VIRKTEELSRARVWTTELIWTIFSTREQARPVVCQKCDDRVSMGRANESRSGGMADALDSKSSDRKVVWVQVPPSVLLKVFSTPSGRLFQGFFFGRTGYF
jgi:hypothetical protein